ncbi:MAG: hypothetical protein KGL54_15405 [Sphingomonadales bacterium]|nr:hypothetical protein [Sphingomonadales bacterium]
MTRTATTSIAAQHVAIKRQYPDALVAFRVGRDYVLLEEDARAAHAAIGVAVWAEGEGPHDARDLVMLRLPAASAEHYIGVLVRAGHKVAVCEPVGGEG